MCAVSCFLLKLAQLFHFKFTLQQAPSWDGNLSAKHVVWVAYTAWRVHKIFHHIQLYQNKLARVSQRSSWLITVLFSPKAEILVFHHYQLTQKHKTSVIQSNVLPYFLPLLIGNSLTIEALRSRSRRVEISK